MKSFTLGSDFSAALGRPKIDLSTEQEFRKAKNLKMVDADDMGPGEGALRPEQVAAALNSDADS